ncbi:alpha/beta fold hydrolase [Pseudomonas sp. A214]|uniref:alpha/beta fold hydrolase n=1 Tax=Pseudomonas sp. A214 TaxID=1855331 RepID=UPI001E3B29F9|nr:alpha/beta hydrolase [Pseudomonas sp. A214]
MVKLLLVIQGREDYYATPEQLVVIQRQVPGPCSCVLLDNSRHFPQTEATERALQLMCEFLERLPALI